MPLHRFLRWFVVLFAAAGAISPAAAHPHVWVTMHTDLVYAPDGSITGVRHKWAFDDMFSAFATQGLQSKEKGKFTRDELAPLAKVNIDSLKEYDYFTYVTVDGKKTPLGEPMPGYWLDYKDSVLTLNFTLPFKTPVKSKLLKIEVYDPTIFVDFEFAKDKPVQTVGAPSGCKMDVVLPKDITPVQSQTLGESFFNQLSASSNFGEQFANRILVICP
jgi:ABC-type uncharacterized transport system substrate-binding protein